MERREEEEEEVEEKGGESHRAETVVHVFVQSGSENADDCWRGWLIEPEIYRTRDSIRTKRIKRKEQNHCVSSSTCKWFSLYNYK